MGEIGGGAYTRGMRIISGRLAGRVLRSPPSDATRPITDRAKQSLFDLLCNCFEGGVVLDCFAGTGSMGLECLSRGAKRAVFVERDRGAVRVLRENIAELGVGEAAVVLAVDAYAAAEHPEVAGKVEAEKLTVAFVDPPYAHMATGHLRHKVDRLVSQLAARCMVDGGIISLRHPATVSVDAGGMGVKVVRELKYGDMGITWVTKG